MTEKRTWNEKSPMEIEQMFVEVYRKTSLQPAAIDAVAAAMSATMPDPVLTETLARLFAQGFLADPQHFAAPRPDRYTRKLLYRDPDGAFAIVSMTWLPGQRAAIHDHAGLHGAEIVVAGSLVEHAYSVIERNGDLTRFNDPAPTIAAPGTVSVVSPPSDIHAVYNASDTVAHTIHVYSGDLTSLRSYALHDATWYRATHVSLAYDD